jgi:hypothetical protein
VMPALAVISPREASIFACLCDTFVAPDDSMAPVAQTDAAFAFDRLLDASPRLNRFGLRALVYALEIAPLLTSDRKRLRRLSAQQRSAALDSLERASDAGAGLINALRAVAHISYYGDDAVMRGFGYDADAVVARGASLRAQEARW